MTDPGIDQVVPLSLKQKRVLAECTFRVNLLEGSIRSGKTFSSLIAWLIFVTEAPRRGSLLMVGKSRDSVFRNVFEPLENDPALSVFKPFVHYRQGSSTAVIFGRTVHVMGAADAQAETKLRGMTVCGIYADEVTTLPREFFRQCLGRMSVPGARMFGTTNPDAPNHWLKAEYLDRRHELPDWYVQHFTMDDNPGLTDDYKNALKREYTGVWHQRFIEGLWVAAEGAVYPHFDQDVHVIAEAQLPRIEQVLCVGLDYGTVHRTRAYLIGMGVLRVGPSGQIMPEDSPFGHLRPALFVLDEFAPGDGTVGQHAVEFRDWLDASEYGEPQLIACDPAAAAMRRELFEMGVMAVKAHNSVLPGIQVVSSLLASGGLFIVGKRAPHLVKNLPGYRWDSKSSARGLTVPIKENDDEVDALRYSVYTSRRFWRVQIPLAAAEAVDSIDTEEAA